MHPDLLTPRPRPVIASVPETLVHRTQAEQDAMVEAETRRRAHTIGESVTPAPDGSVSMPVCLLDMLLFPHQPVTLFLFEPR